jgi:protein O-GlcNAc transferase
MKVISFSLWGDKPIYNIGSIENAKIAKELYPDFVCYFYCHKESVPQKTIDSLLELDNTKIIFREDFIKSSTWRFEAIDEPEVEIMLSRDADSRIFLREKIAVDEWLSSDKLFHIMRDHPDHRMPIMAGMFGTKKIPEIKSWSELLKNVSSSHYGNDQDFLSGYVYPVIRKSCFIHASYNKIEGIECKDFAHTDGNKFVGQYIYV